MLLASTALISAALAGPGPGPGPERAVATTDCDITAPANVTKGTDPNQPGATVTYSAPTTTGTCSTITCTPPSGSFFPIGTTLVKCTSSTSPPAEAGFTVRVNDTQAPVVIPPANVSVANDAGRATANVTFPSPTATDNAPGVTVSCNRTATSQYPLGTTTVTCTARDAAGNTTAGNFTVTVNDTEPPVFEAAPDIVALIRPSTDAAQVFYATPGAHDNSDIAVPRSCAPASGGSFPLGETTVNCTATDIFAGNTATTSFKVTVYRDPYWCVRSRQVLQVAKLKLKALKKANGSPAKIRQAKQRVREGKLGVKKACADTAPVTSRR